MKNLNLDSIFPSNYIKATDVEDGEVQVAITDIKMEDIGQDADKESKAVVYFDHFGSRGLVLNKTNGIALAEISGSRSCDDWIGLQVTLYKDKTSFQGRRVDCLRIKEALEDVTI
jgi:hypothetical protein